MAKGSPTLSEVGLHAQSQSPGKAKIRIAAAAVKFLDKNIYVYYRY
jgi:hypothetical protein